MLNRLDLILLSLLTLFWGVNWPIMKYAVTNFPPLTFRVISMVIGLMALFLYVRLRGESLFIPKEERRRVIHLAIGNMLIWHLFAIYAVKLLSSGRAAIIGYTMPVWALLASVFFFKGEFTWRGGLGVFLALCATLLLAAEEFSAFLGQPLGLGFMLIAAMGWGLGTAMMNHLKVSASNTALSFWMMSFTCLFVMAAAVIMESMDWRWPDFGEWMAILFNAFVIFGFCHVVWFRLARKLPPVVSSLSIMLIPALGVFSGVVGLGEKLGPYDLGALVFILLSMAAVLIPQRRARST